MEEESIEKCIKKRIKSGEQRQGSSSLDKDLQVEDIIHNPLYLVVGRGVKPMLNKVSPNLYAALILAAVTVDIQDITLIEALITENKSGTPIQSISYFKQNREIQSKSQRLLKFGMMN